jgi:pimeloyl-ACP methyl ester carboxylesterase
MRIAMWQLFKSMKAAPLLIIRGHMSDILSEKTVKKMVKRHPDAVLVNVPRVGHAPLLDEPEATEAISAFLARLATRV